MRRNVQALKTDDSIRPLEPRLCSVCIQSRLKAVLQHGLLAIPWDEEI